MALRTASVFMEQASTWNSGCRRRALTKSCDCILWESATRISIAVELVDIEFTKPFTIREIAVCDCRHTRGREDM